MATVVSMYSKAVPSISIGRFILTQNQRVGTDGIVISYNVISSARYRSPVLNIRILCIIVIVLSIQISNIV